MTKEKLSFKKSFDVIGKEGVPRYKQSLENHDRVATGKTKNSIRYVATDNKLTFYALDHIRDLETGQTAAQVQSKNPFFAQIEAWVEGRRSRGDNVPGAKATLSMILKHGWNTTLPNRTNPNGGTKGIITDIDDLIIAQTKESLAKDTKSQILKTLKTTKPS